MASMGNVRISAVKRTLPCLVLFCACGCLASAAPREERSLNGSWEHLPVKDLQPGPPGEGWKPFTVPGLLRGYDYERAWFRRSFTVPAAMRGKRVMLEFGGVKCNSQVHLNGQAVDRGRQEFTLGPAGQQMHDVVLSMPDAHPPTDPVGKTRALFDAHGLRPAPVAMLDKLDAALELLVIGAGALRGETGREPVIGREHPQRTALLEFVRRGGRLLVLEQEVYPMVDVHLDGRKVGGIQLI